MQHYANRILKCSSRISAGLIAVAILGTAGCHSDTDSSDFGHMSKAEQIKAIGDIPPKERAMADKMRASIAATIHAGASGSNTPQIPAGGTAH
jgi:hypothetical protein